MKHIYTLLVCIATSLGSNGQTAIQFTDTTQGVDLGQHSAFGIDDEVSIEAWVKFSTPEYQTFVSAFDVDGNGDYYGGWWLGTNEDGEAWWWIANPDSSDDYNIESTSIISDGNWHHVAGTFSNGIARVYVDGTMENEVNIWDYDFDVSINAFVGIDNEGYGYDGTIDDVRIWNDERSGAEVSSFMNTCMVGNEASLVATYQFEEGTGSIAADLSPNGFDGALMNMSQVNWVGGHICTPSSVSDAKNETEFGIYPNPSNGIFTVNVEMLDNSESVEIIDLKGRVVYTTLVSQSNQTTVETNLESGIYLLSILNENGARNSQRIQIMK